MLVLKIVLLQNAQFKCQLQQIDCSSFAVLRTPLESPTSVGAHLDSLCASPHYFLNQLSEQVWEGLLCVLRETLRAQEQCHVLFPELCLED